MTPGSLIRNSTGSRIGEGILDIQSFCVFDQEQDQMSCGFRASRCGKLEFNSTQSDNQDEQPIISIKRGLSKRIALVPNVGNLVLARVVRVNPRYAFVDLLSVGSTIICDGFKAQIRSQDVRAHDVDSVVIYKAFLPGDIVRARVISMGDYNAFYLSTAENQLGVVFARSTAGAPMIPVSWEHMQCPITKAVEARKVANSGVWSMNK